jgi:hypothetical protein
VAGGAGLLGQPIAAERFVNDELRPYYAHTGFSWKIDRMSHFDLNYEAETEAERRIATRRSGRTRARFHPANAGR